MLYAGLILFGCLVAWMVREESRTARENDFMNDYRRAEYQLSFPTTN